MNNEKILLSFANDCDTHLLKFLVPSKFCEILSLPFTHVAIYLNSNRVKLLELVDGRQFEGRYYKIEVDPIMARLACNIYQFRSEIEFSGLDVRLLNELNDFIDWKYLEENEKTSKSISRYIWEFSQFDAGHFLIYSGDQLEFNKEFMDEITEYSEKNSYRIKYPKLQELINRGGVMAVSEWMFYNIVSMIVQDYQAYLNCED